MVNRILIRGLDNNGDDFNDSEFNIDDLQLNEYIGEDADPQRDKIVEGRVVRVENDYVIIDVGSKSEGPVPLSEWEEGEEAPKPGDIVKVLVEETEDTMTSEEVASRGMIVLSKRKAAKIENWNRMIENVKEGDVVEGKVSKKIKGGLLVDIDGVSVFLPASQVDVRRPADISEFIDKSIKCVILKIDTQRRNIVVSRRRFRRVHRPRRHRRSSSHHGHELGPRQRSSRSRQDRSAA